MKQLKFFTNPPPDNSREALRSAKSGAVAQELTPYSTITVVNAGNPKQKLYCHALIEVQDPSRVFLVVFDKCDTVSIRAQQGFKIDYVQFILSQVYQQSSLQATYDRLNKLYVDETHTEITRELITRCILAKSTGRKYTTVRKQLSTHPIQIIVPQSFFASIAFQHPIQQDPTVSSRTQSFLLPKNQPSSTLESTLLSEDEFAECFADIEAEIDTTEYESLTLALAFDLLTPQQQTRLNELKSSNPELHEVLKDWSEHLRIKYVGKGFKFTQVQHIHRGNYEQAGVFLDDNELTTLFDFQLTPGKSHHVSDM